MSAVLYAGCDAMEEFLRTSPLKRRAVWPAGPPGKARDPAPAALRVCVSDADGRDFDRQVSDALQFLRANQQELTRLAAEAGAKMHLFFVAGKPASPKPGGEVVAWHCNYPAELVRLAASFGMSLGLKCDPLNLHGSPGAEPGATANRPRE